MFFYFFRKFLTSGILLVFCFCADWRAAKAAVAAGAVAVTATMATAVAADVAAATAAVAATAVVAALCKLHLSSVATPMLWTDLAPNQLGCITFLVVDLLKPNIDKI